MAFRRPPDLDVARQYTMSKHDELGPFGGNVGTNVRSFWSPPDPKPRPEWKEHVMGFAFAGTDMLKFWTPPDRGWSLLATAA